jgi:hypothetical protein
MHECRCGFTAGTAEAFYRHLTTAGDSRRHGLASSLQPARPVPAPASETAAQRKAGLRHRAAALAAQRAVMVAGVSPAKPDIFPASASPPAPVSPPQLNEPPLPAQLLSASVALLAAAGSGAGRALQRGLFGHWGAPSPRLESKAESPEVAFQTAAEDDPEPLALLRTALADAEPQVLAELARVEALVGRAAALEARLEAAERLAARTPLQTPQVTPARATGDGTVAAWETLRELAQSTPFLSLIHISEPTRLM